MTYSLTPQQIEVRELAERVCKRFDDEFWMELDQSARFPDEFHRAVADAGLLGIAMPAEFGGSGLGISEAAVLMQTIAESGACMSGASAVHLNIFGLNPVVVFGTVEQKARMLIPLIRGEHKACFAVTEPDAGTRHRTDPHEGREMRPVLRAQWTKNLDIHGPGRTKGPCPSPHDTIRAGHSQD